MKSRHIFSTYRDSNGTKRTFDVKAQNKKNREAKREAIKQAQKELDKESAIKNNS